MSNLEGFNAADWEPTGEFEPIPEGDYVVVITESDREPTKDKSGEFLKLKIQVVDESQYRNRVIFERLNLKNKSQQAVEIAKRKLGDICRAVGKLQPKDSAELHNIPILARVGISPAKGEYGPQNYVKMYRPVNGSTQPPAEGPTPPPSPTPMSAPPKKAPWSR